ncbi:MAG: ArsR family transcriptional regulator [Thermoproteota archaeon]
MKAEREDIDDILKGQTLQVYRYLLDKGKPVSVRQVQAGVRLKSPSLAFYHLSKLQEAGLIKLQRNGYVVKKVYLKHYIKFSKLLIPRFFFYFIFFTLAFCIDLLLLRPEQITRDYTFSLLILFLGAVFFLYETVRIFLRERI